MQAINHLNNRLSLICFAITLLIFTFVTYPGATEGTIDPVVWYFNSRPILIAFYIVLLSFCVIIVSRPYLCKIDIYLISRIIICLIPVLYIPDSSSLSAHYPVVILTFMSFIIGANNQWKDEQLYRYILIICACVWSFQVFRTSMMADVSYSSLEYKSYIRIPIAASNVIAAYLAPISFLVAFGFKCRKLLKYLIFSFICFAIVLTKSRGGVLSLVITYFIYLVVFKYKISIPQTLFFFLLFFSILYFLFDKIPAVKVFLLGFEAEASSYDFSGLSSGRLEIYAHELKRFLTHPLFGNGMIFNDTTSTSGAHNFIIELLVQSGIVGAMTYLIPIILIIKKYLKQGLDEISLGWLLMIICFIIGGLEEVTFFNYSTDFIFWTACGLVYSKKCK